MKSLYFIHRFPFNKEAFNRDEFEYFSSQGYNVKYLEISHLLKKRKFDVIYPESIKQYVIHFKSRKAFKNFLKLKSARENLIITDVGLLANSAWMFLAIFKANIPYILFENAVLPLFGAQKITSASKLKSVVKRINFKKLLLKPIDVAQLSLAKSKKQKPQLVITSKNKLSTEKRNLLTSDTKVLKTVSMDYHLAESLSDKREITEKYAVFIDQFFVHHPDFKTNYIVHHFTAEEYYSELNAFFKYFEKETGLKVIIAAHPRRANAISNDFDDNFPVYFNKTALLVKHSELVLQHFSTAINYIAIFNKPFLLLDSDLFEKSTVRNRINMFNDFFHVSKTNMSKIISNNKPIKIPEHNMELYAKFMEKYVKNPDAENLTFKEIILQFLLN